jgi:hypothetical protein
MSTLVDHARYELELAGLLDRDSDYDGMIGEAALEVVTLFSKQGHSGMSAEMVTAIVTKLLRYKPLTPLTYAPDEWVDQSEASGGNPTWQNRRDFNVFSKDGGKTHYSVKDVVAKTEKNVTPRFGRAFRIEMRQVSGNGNDRDLHDWIKKYTLGSFDPRTEKPPESGVSIDPETGNLLLATPKGVICAPIDWWVIQMASLPRSLRWQWRQPSTSSTKRPNDPRRLQEVGCLFHRQDSIYWVYQRH